MTKHAFDRLCERICRNIGEEDYRPERSIISPATNKAIPGEVKTALSIRMLAGGSYLDLVPLFEVSSTHLYIVFNVFLDWILLTFEFPLVKWLREENWRAINHLANHFAEKTDGIFYGPFAAVDGLAIRIRSPRLKEVSDPGNYYCRKGFYALNVQACCDRSKRFLWCYPSNKGSTHDSVAFSNSRLYELLKEKTPDFIERGLFIVGDSAYGLSPFLMVPYDSDEMKEDVNHNMDSFNYHLSSCRIYIECAFGELIMRWGIFWRTLLFDLRKCSKIIQVSMLLHNFIIDSREGRLDDRDNSYFQQFDIIEDSVQDEITEATGEMPRAIVSDNNEPRRCGRPSVEEEEHRQQGILTRHNLTIKLAVHEMKRPLQSDMHYNSHGHIYMTS